jgi:hypothetical protein
LSNPGKFLKPPLQLSDVQEGSVRRRATALVGKSNEPMNPQKQECHAWEKSSILRFEKTIFL